MLSDWYHPFYVRQLFSRHVFREYSTWTHACEIGGEPHVKSQAIPRSAPAWYSKAVKKVQLSTTGEPKFTLRVPNVGG